LKISYDNFFEKKAGIVRTFGNTTVARHNSNALKFYSRLLLTIPFIIVTIGYCKFNNPDEKCQGLANLMLNGFFILLLLTTLILALRGIFRKRKLNKTKFEPITFSITTVTFIILILYPLLAGHTRGVKWISAENKDYTQLISRQNLTLRKNGNFTVNLIEADFSCSISGKYKKVGDTILLDEATIDRTNSKIASKYLIQKNELVPLIDTINKITFKITSIN